MGTHFVKKNKFQRFNIEQSTNIVLREINKSLQLKNSLTIGLAGGDSLNIFYKFLAKKWNLNLSKINFFLIDERLTKNLELRNELHLDKVFFSRILKNLKIK